MRLWWILAFAAGVVALLAWRFPYAMAGRDQQLRILYLVLLLAVVAGRSRLLRRTRASQALKHASLWLIIILALVFAHSFRDELKYNRLIGELMPSRVQMSSAGALMIRTAQDGHFHIEADVNGEPVDCIIDTGASDIVLSPADAARAGFPVDTLNYSRTYSTANGTVSGAPVKIRELIVGSVTLHDVPASVNSAAMDESLLGMSFLNQFHSYSVDGNTLTLRP